MRARRVRSLGMSLASPLGYHDVPTFGARHGPPEGATFTRVNTPRVLTRDLTSAVAGSVDIGSRLLAIMAIGSAVAVANLYYIQPLLADIGRTFAASPSAMGLLATIALAGFATGMVLFVR